MKTNLEKLLEKCNGDKEEVAKRLMISKRYVEMILAGTKNPSKRLEKLILIEIL